MVVVLYLDKKLLSKLFIKQIKYKLVFIYFYLLGKKILN